jgi:flagellin-like protein
MKPSNLFNSDDRAVSPVIGVILMVAITVILAAVIGTFVLGLGDSLGDSQPTAQLDVTVDTNTVSVEHAGGDPIEADELRVIVSNTSADTQVSGTVVDRLTVGDIASNTTAGGGLNVSEGDEYRIRVIHQSSDSIIVDRTADARSDIDLADGFELTV